MGSIRSRTMPMMIKEFFKEFLCCLTTPGLRKNIWGIHIYSCINCYLLPHIPKQRNFLIGGGRHLTTAQPIFDNHTSANCVMRRHIKRIKYNSSAKLGTGINIEQLFILERYCRE